MAHVVTMILVAVTLTGAITDAMHGKVYNWLTYPAAVLGVALSFAPGAPEPLESVAGFGLGLGLFGTLRGLGRMGGGDV